MLRKGVSSTALLALYWKHIAKDHWDQLCQHKGVRKKAHLFKDPVMDQWINEFMGDEVKAAVKEEAERILKKPMWLPLATRTRFFRRTIANYVKSQQITQVISLGSGCDTLAVRKTKYSTDYGVKFFEVDNPSILDFKQSTYVHHGVDPNATYIKLNYVTEDLIAALQANGVDFDKPTLVLWEGNVFYLDKDQVITTLTKLSDAFANLVVSFDYMHSDMQTKTKEIDAAAKGQFMGKTLEAFREVKAPFKSFFTPEEILIIAEQLGFSVAEQATAAELAIHYEVDEQPFPTAEPYLMTTLVKGMLRPLPTLRAIENETTLITSNRFTPR